MGLGGEGEMPSSRGPHSRNSLFRTCCRSWGFSWRLHNQVSHCWLRARGGVGLFGRELEKLVCVIVCDDDGESVSLTVF